MSWEVQPGEMHRRSKAKTFLSLYPSSKRVARELKVIVGVVESESVSKSESEVDSNLEPRFLAFPFPKSLDVESES